jgi:hypothetical protein
MKQTFTGNELEVLRKLRLSIPGAPEGVSAIVAAFNDRLQQLLAFLTRWYADPITQAGESPLDADFETLVELGQVRRAHRWQLLQSVRDVLAARSEAIRQIDGLIAQQVIEAREDRNSVRQSAENKLASLLSGPELKRAIEKSDSVLEAEDTLRRVQGLSSSLHGGVQNISLGDARKLAESITGKLGEMAAEVACLETMPSGGDGEFYRPVQFINGVSVLGNRKQTVHREVIDPTS